MENAPAVRAAEDSFQIMDRLDDELIEAELKNRVVNTWSYSFQGSDGRLQEGLSKVGVDESCVEMSKQGYIIREGKITWAQDPTDLQYILFDVPASLIRITSEAKEVLMDVVNGTKRQWINMKLKSGSVVKDPFWFEKGAMKAARNARSRLIPSEVKTKILVLARQGGKTRKIDEKDNIPEFTPPVKEEKKGPGRPPKKQEGNGGLSIIPQLNKFLKADKDEYYKVIGQHGASSMEDVLNYEPEAQQNLLADLAKAIDLS